MPPPPKKKKFSLQRQPPEVFYKKGVPKHFAKFTGKHMFKNRL